MKITVVGAGNVGATCAEAMVRMELAEEIVLLDIKEGFAEGKAMDMNQTANLHGFKSKVHGVTNNYAAPAGSKVVVITSGIPRKPGMTREELIGTNAGIVKSVVDNALKHSPEAVIVVISNPMDTMTYLAAKQSGLPKNRVIGMGGLLDSARFTYYLSEAMGVPASDLQGVVVGGHGDTTMIPLTRLAIYQSTPVTMVGGATLTGLIGTSAWYAPGAAGAVLTASIVRNQKKIFPCSVYLEGEYGESDICMGVPVVVGENGWESIVDYRLNAEEAAEFAKSAAAVRAMNTVLDTL